MRPAVFFDRDGVLIEQSVGYLLGMEQYVPIPGVPEAVLSLSSTYELFTITNQACVGKGLISYRTCKILHNNMLARLGILHKITRSYICPHIEGTCECRKPGTYFVEEAIREYDLDRGSTYLVGDFHTDFECAVRAGIIPVRVLTGRALIENIDKDKYPGLLEFQSLGDFASHL